MTPEYIIVQAGGKGTRLKHLTKNRPKALVPIKNLPMIFHLFRKFPNAKYIIIADYKADVMRKYMDAFAEVQYLIVDTNGAKGTCAGIRNALRCIPKERTFMLIWSDLILPKDFVCPQKEKDYIGIAKDFRCRWRYRENEFEEIASDIQGVAGLFLFKNKESIQNVPIEGEFVRWLKEEKKVFEEISLEKTREYGILSEVEKEEKGGVKYRCRPFNQIEESQDGKRLVKKSVDKQGEKLAAKEKEWYRFVSEKGFANIPHIYSYEPFVMERINGSNIFEYEFERSEKEAILTKLIECLHQLHQLSVADIDFFSISEAYVKKTWKRIDTIRELVPFTNEETIVINGKKCRNVFFHKRDIEKRFEQYKCDKFVLLHGDNTFSNIVLNENKEPILIDPRGYFGYTKIHGDPVYDWAKLYYSIVGNYDQFNRKRFTLEIKENDVELLIESNGWEDMEDMFFSMLADEVDKGMIKLIHAIIWLSLTTYAWEDYDSICGAFYNGLYYLEDVL